MAGKDNKINRLILLNQMAGPLFRELAEGVADSFSGGCLLITGHPDTLLLKQKIPEKLELVEAPGYDRSSMFRRFLSWIKYLVFATIYIWRAGKDQAFLLVSNPPMLGGWFWLLNKIKKHPYIILVYDIHPDVLVSLGTVSGKNPLVLFWGWMNKKVYRDAMSVVTLGNFMSGILQKKLPINAEKIQVIPPWVDVEFIKPCKDEKNPLIKEFNPEGKQVVLYSGNMGISHDIDSMLEAARLLRERNDILFLFIGSGQKWTYAKNFIVRHKLKNIRVYPFQSEENLPYTMALASVSLVALDSGAEGMMIPSKLFYYMASGSAIVGICNRENDLRDVIETTNCGICIEPGKPQKLAKKLEELLDDKKNLESFQVNARAAAVDQYSHEAGIEKFHKLFKQIGLIEIKQELL